MHIELAGEVLILDAERAAYWPRRQTLIVADVHLGKGAAFRRAGVAVPSGSTAHSLQRLDALVQRHRPQRLLVLGDLFHAALQPDEPWFESCSRWRSTHAALAIEVLRGNHDRSPERALPDWRLHWVGDARVEPPFVLMHEPRDDARGYGLGGHLHPVLRLRRAGDSLRLPAFWLRPGHAVLPSFGNFTGGLPIRPAHGDRVVLATPDGLVEAPLNLRRTQPCDA